MVFKKEMSIHIKTYEQEEWTLLFVDATLKTSSIDLQKVNFPEVDKNKGLIISSSEGWMGDATSYAYHNQVRWIARYEARLMGAVVVYTNSRDRVIGELIKIKLPCLKCKEMGIEKWIRAGAKYPYCTQHQDSAPHRWQST